MKKIFLFIAVVLLSMTIQAQDDTLDLKSVRLQTYSNESDSLYKGHNYNYYNEIYKKAITCKRTGVVLTILGLGAGITGGIYMNIDFDIGTPLLLSGLVVTNVGASLWIMGGIIKVNNKDAMEQIRRKTSLSFGPTNDGIGLTLHF